LSADQRLVGELVGVELALLSAERGSRPYRRWATTK
jgi:hypothetical protein